MSWVYCGHTRNLSFVNNRKHFLLQSLMWKRLNVCWVHVCRSWNATLMIMKASWSRSLAQSKTSPTSDEDLTGKRSKQKLIKNYPRNVLLIIIIINYLPCICNVHTHIHMYTNDTHVHRHQSQLARAKWFLYCKLPFWKIKLKKQSTI